MHRQHPQTAYRKYAVLIGTIFENCGKKQKNARHAELCDERFFASVSVKSPIPEGAFERMRDWRSSV